mmetsp:Transcript_26842/g.84990  ORF Transcript_26842/g.84990 Transcript_26842/m.84990 type:complete len:200 (-) Transcript_26842:54-653(-)
MPPACSSSWPWLQPWPSARGCANSCPFLVLRCICLSFTEPGALQTPALRCKLTLPPSLLAECKAPVIRALLRQSKETQGIRSAGRTDSRSRCVAASCTERAGTLPAGTHSTITSGVARRGGRTELACVAPQKSWWPCSCSLTFVCAHASVRQGWDSVLLACSRSTTPQLGCMWEWPSLTFQGSGGESHHSTISECLLVA